MHRLALLAALFSLTVPAAVRFGTAQQVLDLRQHDWQYILEGDSKTEAQAMARTDWKPIRVGQRWDEIGFAEIKRQNVWLRITFTPEGNLSGRKVGFFATLIDDEADIFLNGRLVTSVKFSLGDLLRQPAVADLTGTLALGRENILLLHIRDNYVRSTGVVGNVCLFQTLPFQRTPSGGIVAKTPGPLSVVLHLGDAVLSQGERTEFAPGELAALSLPPYILREDELILVAPRNEMARPPVHRVDLSAVHSLRAAQPLSVRTPPLPATVPRYGFVDLPVELTATYDNPFDPRQINVQALILRPSGKIDKVPAFFRQSFLPVAPSEEEEILLPVKGAPWHIYYRAQELGAHKVEILANDRSGIRRYDAGSFQSIASDAPGYLRVSKRDPSFFEYDNGSSFFAIGPSGWYRGRDYLFGGETRWVSSRKLEQYYERKAANRSNYEYLGTFHFGQLLLNGGIIDQHIAWKLEHSLRTMERLGIRWLFFHDDICRMSRYGFDALPYAASNGGPATELNEVYFNQRAMDVQKSELRYLVGRMADSPALWMWNIGDEWRRHFGNKFSISMVRAWIVELHAAVKELDVYRHPHAIGEGDESILNGGDVYLLEGWYLNHPPHPGGDWRKGRRWDLVEHCSKQVNDIRERSFPTINVEGGLFGWNNQIYQSGKPWGYPEALTFHQNLWLGLFLKNAASGTEWLVNVLDNDNQLFHAKALAQFLDGENLIARPFRQSTAATTDPKLTGFALTSERKSLAWVVNRTWNWLDFVEGRKPTPLSGQSVTIPVQQAGRYEVELWNTQSGAIDRTLTLESSGPGLQVSLPTITTDIAVKCIRHE